MRLPEKLRPLIVKPSLALADAINIFNDAGRRILLVCNDDGFLCGIITDFDIRSSILKRTDLNDPVSEIMQTHPIVGSPDMDLGAAISRMERDRINHLPIVDADGRLVDIHFLEDHVQTQTSGSSKMAVIMAGGLGTRLRPITEHTPKPLLTVGGRPILFIMLDQILIEDFGKIYVTLNYKSEMIVQAIQCEEKYRGKVEFIYEDQPLGTAGSLSLLPQRPRHPFAVINADLLTNLSLGEMFQFHEREKNAMTVATKPDKTTIPYGVVELDGTRIVKLSEKPSFTYFINTGVYVVNPDVLDLITQNLSLDMTGVVDRLLQTGQRVGSFPVHEYWLDIGTHHHLEKAREDYVNHFMPDEEDGAT